MTETLRLESVIEKFHSCHKAIGAAIDQVAAEWAPDAVPTTITMSAIARAVVDHLDSFSTAETSAFFALGVNEE